MRGPTHLRRTSRGRQDASPCRACRGWRRQGGTVHVVGRCNNREFCFTGPEDFHSLMAHLGEMARTYTVTLYGYTLMANHVHLLLQVPLQDRLARPLRWFFRETTRAWQRARGRRGHFWERRYWACLVEDDTYALAVLRYLDRNPVRAGLVEDPLPVGSAAFLAPHGLKRRPHAETEGPAVQNQ